MYFSFIHSVTTRPQGRVNGDGSGDGLPVPNGGERDGDASVEAISERILYWLSLDTQVRALAERLLPKVCRNSERSASQRRTPPREHSGYIGIRSKARSRLGRLSPLWLVVGAKDGTVSQFRAVWRKAWGCGR